MAETTIGWCATHIPKLGIVHPGFTFNAWEGCTEVGPGCDDCYARARDEWLHKGAHWGAGAPRLEHKEAYWKLPAKWDKEAASLGTKLKVFGGSLMDWADNDNPRLDELRARLFEVIRNTPNLIWILLTKRIGNIAKMLPEDLKREPRVWILGSFVNQEEWDRDAGKLFESRGYQPDAPISPVLGISYEPAIGPVDWKLDQGYCFHCRKIVKVDDYKHGWDEKEPCFRMTVGIQDLIRWIIPGGESKQRRVPRPFDLAWPRSTIKQGKAAGVPVFVKQLGSAPHSIPDHISFRGSKLPRPDGFYRFLNHPAGADPEEWPHDLRVQEFPL